MIDDPNDNNDLRQELAVVGRAGFWSRLTSFGVATVAAVALMGGILVLSLVPKGPLIRWMVPAIDRPAAIERVASAAERAAARRASETHPAVRAVGGAVDWLAVAMGCRRGWSAAALDRLAEAFDMPGFTITSRVRPSRIRLARKPVEPPASRQFEEALPNLEPVLSPETVAAEIRRQQAAVRAVYERALKRDPNLRGRIEIRFRIDAQGKACDPVVEVDTVRDPQTRQLLVAALTSWHFRGASRGDQQFTYPFDFQPIW